MKHRYSRVGLVATATSVMVVLGSCVDDTFVNRTTNGDTTIHFTTTMVESEQTSRSDSKSPYYDFKAEKLDNADLYLVEVATEGIDNSQLLCNQRDNEAETELLDLATGQPMSRATQVTAGDFSTTYKDKHVKLYAYAYPSATSYNGHSGTSYTLSDVITENHTITPYITDEDLTISGATNSDGSYQLTPTNTHYWTSSDYRISFFGIFPSNTDYSPSVYTYSFENSTPKLTCTVDENVANQRDILVAQFSEAGDGKTTSTTWGSVNFAMQHIMSGVRVTLGDYDDSTKKGFKSTDVITAVTFKNVRVKAVYNLASNSWEDDSFEMGNRSFTCDASESRRSLNSENGCMFMMLPQNMTSGATIEVKVTDTTTGQTTTYSKEISNHKWLKGYSYHYQLSVDQSTTDYYIGTDYDTMYFSWNGTAAGKGDAGNNLSDQGLLRVKSYKCVTTNSGKQYSEVSWTASVTADSGSSISSDMTYPKTSSAATLLSESSTDATDYATYTTADDFTVKKYNRSMEIFLGKQSRDEIQSADEAAMSAFTSQPLKGWNETSGQYYDLTLYSQAVMYDSSLNYYPYRWQSSQTSSHSTSSGGTRFSSNCYMICHPGKYTFPCVYGNGIYNNAVLWGSFQTGATGYALGSNFPKASGTISNPWMNSGNGTNNPASAELLWTDVNGLIENNSVTLTNYNTYGTYNSAEYYVRFSISRYNLKPGNAVIAVKDSSGTILWSWHIWVTPYATAGLADQAGSFTADVNRRASGSIGVRTYLNRPLGYRQLSTYKYDARSYKLLLTQDGNTGKTKTVNLIQRYHTFPRHTCVYYQWGRKDPFPSNIHKETGHMYIDDRYETTLCTSESDEGVTIYYNRQIMDNDNNGVTLNGVVTQPTCFYTRSSSVGSNRIPYNTNYYDMWGCTRNYTSSELYNTNGKDDLQCQFGGTIPVAAGISARKTVYDPCPVGFRVPACLEFPAITVDGYGQATNYDYYHMAGSNDSPTNTPDEATLYKTKINTPATSHVDYVNTGGFEFYRVYMNADGTKNTSLGTWFLYAMGEYSTSFDIQGYGQNAYYWTATRWAAGTGTTNHRCFGVQVAYSSSATSVLPAYGNTEFYGRPIMAVFDSSYPVYY